MIEIAGGIGVMRKLSAITLALLISTSAYAAPVILVCKGKSASIRWADKNSPRPGIIERGVEEQVWKMTIDDAAKTLMFYPFPESPQSGSFSGDGDIKHISMQADIEREKGTDWGAWQPISGFIDPITGQFIITIPTPLGVDPQGGFEYHGTCKRAKPLF